MEQVVAESIRVNNEGAMYLMRGNLPAASRAFTEALQLSREVAVVLVPDEETGETASSSMLDDTNTMIESGDATSKEPHQVLSIDACMDHQGTSQGTSSTTRSHIILRHGEAEVIQDRPYSHYYTYHHPIMISQDIELLAQGQRQEGQATPTTEEWGHFLACVATFNISLSLQLKAQQRQEQTLLPVVVRLYRLCLKLIQRSQGFLNEDLRFTLAVLNNLGIAHHGLGQDHSAQTCFDHLWSTLCLEIAGAVVPHSVGDHDSAWVEYAKNVSNYHAAVAEKILPPAA